MEVTDRGNRQKVLEGFLNNIGNIIYMYMHHFENLNCQSTL